MAKKDIKDFPVKVIADGDNLLGVDQNGIGFKTSAQYDTLSDNDWVSLSGLISIPNLTSKIFYALRKNNVIFINLSIYGLVGSWDGYRILTLPEKYRPSIELMPAFSHSASLSDLIIYPDGLVYFSSVNTNGAWGQTLISYPV